MRSQRNRPVAAVAKAAQATSHSHTMAVGQRGDYNMVGQPALSWRFEITMGYPVFRLQMEVLKTTELRQILPDILILSEAREVAIGK